MESSLKNMILTLFVITLVSAISVGFIYGLTKGPIEKAIADKTKNAVAQVVPSFDNDPGKDAQQVTVDGQILKIYTATQGGQVVGYAIESFSTAGFGGMIKLMAGFLPNGTIQSVAVLSQSETPGLGDKINPEKSNFPKQFEGKNPASFRLKVKKDGGDVDAITASTISSRAYSEALQRAYEIFKTISGKEAQNE